MARTARTARTAPCRRSGRYPAPRRRHGSAHPGFTLIELLVVISIIALLIAILLPALRSARLEAQKTASLSNVRQLAIAQHSYAADHSGYASPPASTRADDGSKFFYWPEVLVNQSYVQDMMLYWGPARDVSALDTVNPHWLNEWRHPGYAVNQYAVPEAEDLGEVQTNGKDGNPVALIRLDRKMPDPSKFLAAVETVRPQSYESDGYDGWYANRARNSGGYAANGAMIFSHNGGVVRSYWDAHASGADGSELYWRAEGARYGEFTNTAIGDLRWKAPWYRGWSGNDSRWD